MPADPPAHVLAIQLRRLGDLILATPAFRALKAAWPDARLTVLTEEPFHLVLEGNPWVDEVLIHRRGALDSIRTGWNLKRRGFDLVIDFHGNPSSARLTLQAGATRRVGWALRGRRLAYTHAVPLDPSRPRYAGDQKLDLLRALGVACGDLSPEIVPSPSDMPRLPEILEQSGVREGEAFAVFAPASRRVYKRWDPEKFADLAVRFRMATGAPVLFAGGPGEADQVEAARPHGPDTPFFVRLESLREWVGLLSAARLFVGPDGGAKHIAQALGTATLALFGPQNPVVWTVPSQDGRHEVVRARRDDCRLSCSRGEAPCACLTACPVDQVLGVLLPLWNRVSRPVPAP